MLKKEAIDLYTLQTRIKSGIEGLFSDKILLRAEISAIKYRSGGHCYMELSQSDEKGLVAKAQAIIWASAFRIISPYFKTVTGIELQEGLQILAEVQVSYSQLYGFSLIISDIDAEYTMGLQSIARQRTIDRLTEEGLMDLQKELMMSVLPYNLAVISAPDAAGYRDFMRHLHENEYGFVFHTDLFQALMQGVDSPSSIISAIDEIQSSDIQYDAILILRGGGGKLDLASFDDYNLAAAIARASIPVFTAVGHDQDFHVCDMVAYGYVKTPTALADLFIGYFAEEDERIFSYSSRLGLAFQNRLHLEETKLGNTEIFLMNNFDNRITMALSKLDFLEMKIRSSDPKLILKKGFSLALDSSGVKINSVKGLGKGEQISVMFDDGTLKCSITEIKKNN